MKTFIDANVPIYAAGRDHPLKAPSKEVLQLAAERPQNFFTNAEVLQELLHRYLSLGMWPAGKAVVQGFTGAMQDSIETVQVEDVEKATGLADTYYPELSARDLLHAAMMLRVEAENVVTADKSFDRLSGESIKRLDPADVENWRDALA